MPNLLPIKIVSHRQKTLPRAPPKGLQDTCIPPRDAPETRLCLLQDASKTSKTQKSVLMVPHQAPPGLQADSMAPQNAPRTRPSRLQDESKTTSKRPRGLQKPLLCSSASKEPPDSMLETTWTSWSCILDPCGIVLGRFLAPNSVSLFQSAPPSSRHSHTT